MPVLPNRRHELFAQGLAKGMSQREAYLAAGYETEEPETTDSAACRLFSEVKVRDRVEELLGIAAEAAAMTKERVLVELGTIGFAALGHEFVKASDKRAALSDIGKAIGMFAEKVEITGKDGKDLIPALDEMEVARRMAFVLQRAMVQTDSK